MITTKIVKFQSEKTKNKRIQITCCFDDISCFVSCLYRYRYRYRRSCVDFVVALRLHRHRYLRCHLRASSIYDDDSMILIYEHLCRHQHQHHHHRYHRCHDDDEDVDEVVR